MLQEWLIFPGRCTQGTPASRYVAPPGAQSLSLMTRTGVPIHGLFLPADSSTTLLLFYGNGMCLANAQSLMGDLRSLGLNVAAADYPGYGLSHGKPSEQGCYAMADALYDHLLTRPGVDPQKILLMGISLGGGVAVELATRCPCAGLILVSAFTSLAEVAKRRFPFVPAWHIRHRFENLRKLPTVKAPILIVHGRRDGLVPFSMAQRLRDVAGPRCQGFLPLDEARHNDVFAVAGEQILGEISRFAAQVASVTPAPPAGVPPR